MASKRPNTIGANPLKTDKTSTPGLRSGATDQAVNALKPEKKSKKVVKKVTTERPKKIKKETASVSLPKQSSDIPVRIRRTARETEALFANELTKEKPTDNVVETPVVIVDLKLAQVSKTERHVAAMAIVKTWSQWSVVAGLTPVPVLDTLVLSAAQIKLIQLLCKHYDVPFEKKVALAVATGLVGGTLTASIAGGITRSLVKNIPVAGQIFNWTVEPALSFGATYAIGATFVRHFEADGNLLTFKGEQMNAYIAEQFQKGKKLFLGKKSANAA